MAHNDDYISAKRIAVEKLSTVPFADLVNRAGFEVLHGHSLRIPFLDRIYQLRLPEFEFEDESEEKKEIPIQEQVLILHYMEGQQSSLLTGNWIAYREIPGASFYFSAFIKRAIDPFKKVFGQDIAAFSKAAHRLQGIVIDAGDAAFEFEVFPGVPVQLILWEGDDEFGAEANIIFDCSIGKILSPEDVAWMAGMLVYRLIALAKV
jgi:hypothetical protein